MRILSNLSLRTWWRQNDQDMKFSVCQRMLKGKQRNQFFGFSATFPSPKFGAPWASKKKVRAQKRKDMVKGLEKCNILWIYIKLNNWNLNRNIEMLNSKNITLFMPFYRDFPFLGLSWIMVHWTLVMERLLKTEKTSYVGNPLPNSALGLVNRAGSRKLVRWEKKQHSDWAVQGTIGWKWGKQAEAH